MNVVLQIEVEGFQAPKAPFNPAGSMFPVCGSVGAYLSYITAASVFVKHPEDALVYQERAAAWGPQREEL